MLGAQVLPVAATLHRLLVGGLFGGGGAHPCRVIQLADLGVGVPPAALDAKQQLRSAAHLDGNMAGVPRMGGQRQAVSTCANDGNLIIAGIHLFFHCGKGIKPGIIPGFLPGKALHCRDDGQGGQFRQSVYPAGGVGEQLPALLVLGADGIRKGVYHQPWQPSITCRSAPTSHSASRSTP